MKHERVPIIGPVGIPSLTGLRGIAAISVLVSHTLPQIVKYPADPPLLIFLLLPASAFGMTLFFTLSGFVIYLNYSDRIATRVDFYNFMVARFARLYPLFAACVGYELLISLSHGKPLSEILPSLPFYISMTQSWFYHPIGQYSLIYQYGLLGGVSWSVSTEWGFYFAFPFVCWAILRAGSTPRRLIAATFLFASGAWFIAGTLNAAEIPLTSFGETHFGAIGASSQDGFLRWILYFSPYTRMLEFALGCLCAAVYKALPAASEREQKIGPWLTYGTVLILIAAYAMVHLRPISSVNYLYFIVRMQNNFGFSPLCAMLMFCCARYRSGVTRVLSTKYMLLMGEISYSIYLLHFVILGPFRADSGTITSWQIALGSYARLIVTFATIVGLSLVSWALLEMPCRRALRNWLTIKREKAAVPPTPQLDESVLISASR